MTVAFHTFGCKVNQYETAAITEHFISHGCTVASFDDPADVYIVNSCTVTSTSDRKVRSLLRRVRALHPQAVLVLTGCMAQADPTGVAAKLPEVDIITGVKDRAGLYNLVCHHIASKCAQTVQISPHARGDSFEAISLTAARGQTRAFIKIQDGCQHHCTYCIIPTSRGHLRYKPVPDIITEATALVASGHKEIVLTGINLACYGLGHTPQGQQPPTLLQAIHSVGQIEGLLRLRLGSLEPDLITPALLAGLQKEEKFCPHFHISLQSGCDTVLARMGRRYTTAQYKSLVAMLRQCFDNPAITTDIIAGFPGETDEEFAHTLAFVQETAFADIHAFPYSARNGTVAASMPGQLCAAAKQQRGAALAAAAQKSRQAFLANTVGMVEPVLFEKSKDPTLQEGYTTRYVKVLVPHNTSLRGQILPVQINQADHSVLHGTLL